MLKKRKGLSYSESGKLGYIASIKTNKEKQVKRIKDYNENPKTCKYCGKILDYKHRKNKFCSSSCSAYYNNTIVDKELIKEKKVKSLKKVWKEKLKDKQDKKVKCKYCGCFVGECIRPDVCKKHQLFKTLSKFGFDLNKVGTVDVYNEYDRIKKQLEKDYSEHINDSELNDKYNYTSGLSNFHKILTSLGIEKRTIKQSNIEAVFLGKRFISSNYKKYKTEWHTTWDNKLVYLRSSYEIDYANLLDKNKVEYNVECIRIKYFDSVKQYYRCAIPDFFITKTNELVEIKSKWTFDLQNMKDKFKAYIECGYKPKLILEHKEIDINLL